MVKKIDNTDSRLIYSGQWESLNGQQAAYNDTLSLSTHAGDTISVNFDGISITVTGNVRPANDRQPTPKSSYAIDGDPSFFTFAPSSPLKSEFGKTFFTSKGLQRGAHKLLITNLVDNAPYLIDYITVTEGNGWWSWRGKDDPSRKQFDWNFSAQKVQTSSQTLPSSTTVPPSLSSGTSSTSAAPGTGNRGTATSAGTIAGAVIGSVIGIIVIVSIILAARRHRKTDGVKRDSGKYLTRTGNKERESSVRKFFRPQPQQMRLPTETGSISYKTRSSYHWGASEVNLDPLPRDLSSIGIPSRSRSEPPSLSSKDWRSYAGSKTETVSSTTSSHLS
ncbi:hypothetical protein NLJ89_g8952 [Agrocybe chaxingu]|uniref:Uncharacterized protein n=1 Tax=Agrocybe chaxingu TaxID=84603 RepID=A0A9W8JUG5_9AGAR|nr:hypothetical protein NLJ89_g8952 [Agrocybe chaxingu]